MTNLEWLYSLEPGKLKAWFDADRVTCRECRYMDRGYCYQPDIYGEMHVFFRGGAGSCSWGERRADA